MSRKTLSILDTTPESYKNFSSGRIELDEYLKRYAKGNHLKGFGKTFVYKSYLSVSGFYTISMGSIEFNSLPEQIKKGLPKYPTPIAKIGRLAVDQSHQGKGIGKLLLVDAFYRIFEASQLVAAYAIVVDAKDEKAQAFYTHFGFMQSRDNPLTLFLPLKTIEQIVESQKDSPAEVH